MNLEKSLPSKYFDKDHSGAAHRARSTLRQYMVMTKMYYVISAMVLSQKGLTSWLDFFLIMSFTTFSASK